MKKPKLVIMAIVMSMSMAMATQVTFAETDTNKTSNSEVSSKEIKDAGLPTFEFKSAELNTQLNDIVYKIYEKGNKKLKDDEAVSVTFSYKQFANKEDYISYVIHTEVFAGNTSSDDVDTIVVDIKNNKIVSLKDLLGEKAFAIGDEVINKAIKEDKTNGFFTGDEGFKGLNDSSKFYINDEGKLVFIFNKYEIAPGVSGNPTFSMGLPSKNTGKIAKDIKIAMPKMDTMEAGDFFVSVNGKQLANIDSMEKDSVLMLPLRDISEALGYKVSYNPTDSSVELTKDNDKAKIFIGKNEYKSVSGEKVKLPFAPEIKNGRTLVPAEFFGKVLFHSVMIDGTQVWINDNAIAETISVKKGEKFTVTIEENGTTGYVWNMEIKKVQGNSADGIKLISDENIHKETGDKVGGSYDRVFTFQANQSGEYNIDLVLKRAWENTDYPIERVVFVTVE